MMKEKYKFTLSLFRTWTIFVFAFIAILLMIIGSQVYANTTKTMDKNAALRTAAGYIVNKQRELGVSYEVDENMLIFHTTLEGEKYICRIYQKDDQLIESFLPIDYEFEKGDGEVIGSLDRLDIKEQGKTIRIELGYAGNSIVKTIREAK